MEALGSMTAEVQAVHAAVVAARLEILATTSWLCALGASIVCFAAALLAAFVRKKAWSPHMVSATAS